MSLAFATEKQLALSAVRRACNLTSSGDKSPVTVGDYSAQAVISSMIHHAFPADPIVGEEDAADLRAETGAVLRSRILLDAIDRGNFEGGRSGRMWTIDPIDGTKGFLRGEQYAVCLALLVDAEVQVGVLGCPNLPIDMSNPDGEKGCLFVAVKGQGAQQMKLSGADPAPLSMPPYSPSTFNFLESVEAAHSSHSTNDKTS
ncbi:carbohydrate phosphatase [Gymnopus androsaceus JB14]|uniref:Carbohydrate phosphatase n=1 Tax=Gymnopus androsaceus JB14 TaxID=1447944 RepID=A0A6A4HQB9_9AGAR|nr:carbohydrate phosphatase [Gymnopus androsaceus JB14]